MPISPMEMEGSDVEVTREGSRVINVKATHMTREQLTRAAFLGIGKSVARNLREGPTSMTIAICNGGTPFMVVMLTTVPDKIKSVLAATRPDEAGPK